MNVLSGYSDRYSLKMQFGYVQGSRWVTRAWLFNEGVRCGAGKVGDYMVWCFKYSFPSSAEEIQVIFKYPVAIHWTLFDVVPERETN